jgi:hypothetical protein
MSIESPVGETGPLHDVSHTDLVNALLSECGGGGGNDPFSGVAFMFFGPGHDQGGESVGKQDIMIGIIGPGIRAINADQMGMLEGIEFDTI